MQRAQIPAERDVVVQNAKAGPRFVGRWTVDQSEQDAGGDLQQEQDRRGASEDVPPACVVGRRGMRGRGGERPDEAEATLQPFIALEAGSDGALFQAGHSDLAAGVEAAVAGEIWVSGFGFEQEAWVASVGKSPAWIISESPAS